MLRYAFALGIILGYAFFVSTGEVNYFYICILSLFAIVVNEIRLYAGKKKKRKK